MVLVAFVVSAAAGRAQQVTLPLAEYESLRRRAEPPDVPQPPPPVPIVLESADIELSVGIDSARLTIRMTLAVYRDGWQTITLPGDGNLTSVELGTLEGRVSSGPSDPAPAERVLSCRGVGRHDIQFEAVVPVVSDVAAARPTRSVALTLPLAGTVTGVVQSDTITDNIVLLSGAFAGDASGPGARSFVGKPGEELSVQLLGDSDTADETELPLFFEASSAAMAHVSRSGVELSGFLELDIVQGQMESVRVHVPAGMHVLAVESSNDVELGWDLDTDGALVIRFAEPSIGTLPIELSLARSFAADDGLESFDVPLLVPAGASRLTLVSGLSVDEDGIPILIRAASARRAKREDIDFLPATFIKHDASLFVVRQRQQPPRWRVEWAEADPTSVLASQVDRLVVDVLVGEAGRGAYQYWAVVRSSGALSLTVKPPEGFELVAAERSGRRITPGQSADGIVVPLSAGPEAQIVFLSGLMNFAPPPEKGLFEVPIPALSAPVARVEVRAVLPGERNYKIVSDNVHPRIGGAPTSSWFTVPTGHHVVTGSWSALTAQPSPLSIRAKSKRDKRRWY